MHNALSPGDYWRNGLILRLERRRVLVRGVREQRRVFVSVEGLEKIDSPTKGAGRRALAVVRENMRVVHSAMKHLEVEERVPLPDDPSVTVGYEWLLERERDKDNGPAWLFTPEGGKRKYSVRELLDGVEETWTRERDLTVRDLMLDTSAPLMKGSGPVFISYAHEGAEHAQEVQNLADSLRERGVDAWLDRYVDLPGPEEGWAHWTGERIEKAKVVLVVASQTYLERVEKRDKSPLSGHGAVWEGQLIYQDLYAAKGVTNKFTPVVMRAEDEQYIPRPLRGFNFYRMFEDGGFERLYRALTGQPRIVAPPLGRPVVMGQGG
jgi:hypothetical protein